MIPQQGLLFYLVCIFARPIIFVFHICNVHSNVFRVLSMFYHTNAFCVHSANFWERLIASSVYQQTSASLGCGCDYAWVPSRALGNSQVHSVDVICAGNDYILPCSFEASPHLFRVPNRDCFSHFHASCQCLLYIIQKSEIPYDMLRCTIIYFSVHQCLL